MKPRPTTTLVRTLLVILTIGSMGVRASAAPKFVIWCFGDSLTAGMQDTTTYPNYLEQRMQLERLPVTVVNCGVRGETAVAGVGRLKGLLASAPTKPNVVLLCEGANDRKAGTKANVIKRALNDMIVALTNAKVHVVLISQPDENNQLGVSPPYYVALALQHEVPVAEEILNGIYREAKILKLPYLYSDSDQRHLSSQGNKVFAERLFFFLKTTGLINSAIAKPVKTPVTFHNDNNYDVKVCVYNSSDKLRTIPLKAWVIKPKQEKVWGNSPVKFHVKAFRTGLIDTLIRERTNVTAARTVTVSGTSIETR